MPNIIDSIQISSSTFDVRDKSATTVVNLTQEQYDNLPSSAKTANVLYNITDATAGDLSQYWTSAQTQSAITQATSGLQETLSAGTGIDITDNVISVTGGGGKAIEAGTNISVTTGETADTINCTLPITASTSARKNDIFIGNDIPLNASKYGRMIIGSGNKMQYNNSRTGSSILIATPNSNSSVYNVVKAGSCIGIGGDELEVGYDNISGYGSIAIGFGAKSNINKSLAIGYNTVASGTTQTNINNQIKIDTSNQVYIYNKDNTEMICLQDQLGGGGGITSGEVQSMIDESISGKTDESAFTAHTADTTIHVTTAQTASWDGAVSDISTISGDVASLSGDVATVSGAIPTTYVNSIQKDTDSGYQRFYRFSTPSNYNYFILMNAKINGRQILRSGLSSDVNEYSLVEASAITTSVTSSSTDAQVPSAKAVNDKLGGLSLVKLTQAQYDALATKDSNTLYIING